jgi:hypothetical protein
MRTQARNSMEDTTAGGEEAVEEVLEEGWVGILLNTCLTICGIKEWVEAGVGLVLVLGEMEEDLISAEAVEGEWAEEAEEAACEAAKSL